MSSQADAIDAIRHERELLARHLNELELIVREEPRRFFADHLPGIMAAAFGSSLLIGFLTANRRTRPRRRRGLS